MKLVIVTGMSGAGKGTAVKIMEDMGYYCVDNLPIPLVEQFVDFTLQSEDELEKVAVSIDIRNSNALSELEEVLERIRQKGIRFEILFLEAEDSVLVKRYKETRRSHPLAGGGRIDKGIGLERKKLAFLKEQADYIIDTSNLLVRNLRTEIEKIFVMNKEYRNLFVTIMSFGFKFGVPADCDLVFDVRFLPNPYYIPELKHKTGEDKEVQDFVLDSEVSKEFLEKLTDMVKFLIPNYIDEGKNQLVIGIGCTGGHHRSVTVAKELYKQLDSADAGYGIRIAHRDITR